MYSHTSVVVDRLAVLVRDQHVVHQRHGQVRRDHVRRGTGQHQEEAQRQLAAGTGLAKRHRRNRVQVDGGVCSTLVQIGHSSWSGSSGALQLGQMFCSADLHRLAAQVAVQLLAELVEHADRVQVLAQREAPGGQPAVLVDQFQVADAGVVVVRAAPGRRGNCQSRQSRFARRARQQAAVGDHHQALRET